MGKIRILDQNMINMIAAGEVIERPASVVKELIENSIDAGASKITVAIEDGGRKLISVTDNGCGIDADDLDSAFQSHATSKIRASAELHKISSMGFRGEALASIASVAQIKAVSRVAESLSANCIEIDCGEKSPVSPCSGDYGTTIQVRDLFYKMPARRKFLRTANTEMGHITEQFTRIALANHPDDKKTGLDLTLLHNNRELYHFSEKDILEQRIDALFPLQSGRITEQLVTTRSDEKGMHIYALLGTPDISRTSNKLEYVFLNGRFIRDRFITHAIREAYRGHLEPNRYPVAFLFIEMPYEDYDVNVHPTKIEVRFYNANLVHSQILSVIREKLLSANLQTTAKIPIVTRTDTKAAFKPEYAPDNNIAEAMAEFFKKHRPASQKTIDFNYKYTQRNKPEYTPHKPSYPTADIHVQTGKKFLQLHDSFIVAQTEEGFVLIDQHALHERILYEQLRKRIQSDSLPSQKLLITETIKLIAGQVDTIEHNCEILKKLGIEFTIKDGEIMVVLSFPILLKKAEPLDFIQDLIDILEKNSVAEDAERLLDEVLNMAACKAAVKAGQKLSDDEIEQLLADKETIDYANRCPHGRPSVIEFTLSELEKQFKRT